MSGRVARRYAKALFALARDARALDAVAVELSTLRDAFAEPAIAAVVGSPVMTAARLTEIAREVARRMQLSDLTRKFLGVLADNRRLDQIPAVFDRFQELHDRALGRIRVTIHSASPLASARQAEIAATFGRLTGKTVLATLQVDPALLGGVIVEAEGKVYDGSLRTQFDHLAREMTGARTYL